MLDTRLGIGDRLQGGTIGSSLYAGQISQACPVSFCSYFILIGFLFYPVTIFTNDY
jgi:hypothetical protein